MRMNHFARATENSRHGKLGRLGAGAYYQLCFRSAVAETAVHQLDSDWVQYLFVFPGK